MSRFNNLTVVCVALAASAFFVPTLTLAASVESENIPRFTSAKLIPGQKRYTDDYPPVSLRLQEQGIVDIRYLVLSDGSVGDVQIVRSSGRPRLDEAAITWVKQLRYQPATEDGRPVSVWLTSSLNFRLQ